MHSKALSCIALGQVVHGGYGNKGEGARALISGYTSKVQSEGELEPNWPHRFAWRFNRVQLG